MNILPETLGVGQGVVQTVRPYFELFREDGFAPALSLALWVVAAIFGLGGFHCGPSVRTKNRRSSRASAIDRTSSKSASKCSANDRSPVLVSG